MQVRLCRDSFVRHYDNMGYITNQLTKHDRAYNDAGGYFLKEITREAKEVDEIVKNLLSIFSDVEEKTLKADLLEFITELEDDRYIVTGSTAAELDLKEPTFSYDMPNPKTITTNFQQNSNDTHLKTTSELFYDEVCRESPPPFSVQVELTAECNERCIHCYIPEQSRGKPIDTVKLKSAMKEFHDMGTVGITFSGGDPFLHPDSVELLRYARSLDFSISILTNAVLITDEMVETIKEVNISLMQISVYSMNPEIHDFITQLPNSLEMTLERIDKLIANSIPLQISCPTMKANFKCFKDVLAWAQSKRIKAYTDYIMMARSDLDDDNLANRLDYEETESLLRDLVDLDKDYERSVNEQEPRSNDIEKLKNQMICGAGIDTICIGATGDVFPCPGWQGYVVGNIYQQTFKEIWDESPKLKYIRTITYKDFPQCLECDDIDYCALCFVRNFNENGGDMLGITEHYCKVANINKKVVEEVLKK